MKGRKYAFLREKGSGFFNKKACLKTAPNPNSSAPFEYT
jgi:hypothetical protein